MTSNLRDTEVRTVLRRYSARYVSAQRTAGELRSRLLAILHEQQRWAEPTDHPEEAAYASRQLAEIGRVRLTLERSYLVAKDRARALEAVVAALAAAVEDERSPVPPVPVLLAVGHADFSSQVAIGEEIRAPEVALRGGWSPPG